MSAISSLVSGRTIDCASDYESGLSKDFKKIEIFTYFALYRLISLYCGRIF